MVFVIFFFQDTFFYSLVYDPSVKTLLADKGEIRVGPKYQADIPDMLPEGACFDFKSWEMVSYMRFLSSGKKCSGELTV